MINPTPPLPFEASPSPLHQGDDTIALLYGRDGTERIVACEAAGGATRFWHRQADDRVVESEAEFRPWMILTERAELPGAQWTDLDRTGYEEHPSSYCELAEFSSWSEFLTARDQVRDERRNALMYVNPVRQSLMRSGKTLFKGMSFHEVHRLQLDIETEGLSPNDSAIIMIALSDNRGYAEAVVGTEPEMLERLIEIIQQRDPDIIEGHNILAFDLPFIQRRAEIHNIPLRLGRLSRNRDGEIGNRTNETDRSYSGSLQEGVVRIGDRRNVAIGGTSRPYRPVYIPGRHIIDTYILVQKFDWAKGELAGYGLKEVARTYGIAAPDRIELRRDLIAQIWRQDQERVLKYARQDVEETRRLAEMVSVTEFYQSRMIPDNYGMVALSGNGEKINLLMLRAYLTRGHAIPRPHSTRADVSGGYTEVRRTGVLSPVVKADVESLYPSLMLSRSIRPNTDTLNAFLPLLAELTHLRLEAKARLREVSSESDRHYWDGLQGSFKVLINSFYGYLGTSLEFNDSRAADEVTRIGRELVKRIATEIEQHGGLVIEVDTDGVYFIPPGDVAGEEAEQRFVEKIGSILPAGIRLAFDGRYKAMLSLKTKNYVLETYEGRRIFKGASLRSRADEPYGREFLAEAVGRLLAGRAEEVGELYRQTMERLQNRGISIEKLARRERITEKTFSSSQKKRSAAVARSRSVGDFVEVYERENGELGLLSDYASDERIPYYMEKLYKFACRLMEAFESEEQFKHLIPKPVRGTKGSQGSLFD